MGGGEPGAAHRRDALASPPAEPAGEGVGEGLEKGGGLGRRAGEGGDAGRRALDIAGVMSEVDAEADHHRVAGALEEDARELRSPGKEVVRPFDQDGGRVSRGGFVQRDGSGQR
jgi:hypothetical protein